VSSLEVISLRKRYGSRTAVSNFGFIADSGKITAIIGPDGAGKTTLMRACCGLIEFDGGTVKIMGHDIKHELNLIKPVLGYMPQSFSLYQDLTVEENLFFYAGLYGVDKREFEVKKKTIYDFSGLGQFSSRRAGALSGGMKQKLALGCAVIHDPKILILDEPTTGVDPLSRRQFWDILRKLKSEGATIVVSTAYMDEVSLSDKAVFMFEGVKLAEGIPADLIGKFRGGILEVQIAPTLEIMNRLAALDGLLAHRFGSSIHITVSDDESLERHIMALAACGIERSKIRAIKPGLEDLFIDLMNEVGDGSGRDR